MIEQVSKLELVNKLDELMKILSHLETNCKWGDFVRFIECLTDQDKDKAVRFAGEEFYNDAIKLNKIVVRHFLTLDWSFQQHILMQLAGTNNFYFWTGTEVICVPPLGHICYEVRCPAKHQEVYESNFNCHDSLFWWIRENQVTRDFCCLRPPPHKEPKDVFGKVCGLSPIVVTRVLPVRLGRKYIKKEELPYWKKREKVEERKPAPTQRQLSQI